jgi:RNA polymerase sigma-70 factor (ECF subfamily)
MNEDETTETVDADGALLAAIAAGNRPALAALYDRYASLMLGVALRVVGARGEAEDLLHDVFLEVWKRAGDFDPTRGNVRTWLLLRTRSRAIDRRNSPRLARAISWDDTRAEERAAEAPELGARHARERVRSALAALTADQRVTVELAYFQGLSLGEIAEQMACPVGTVKSRLFTARERLKEVITADGGAP